MWVRCRNFTSLYDWKIQGQPLKGSIGKVFRFRWGILYALLFIGGNKDELEKTPMELGFVHQSSYICFFGVTSLTKKIKYRNFPWRMSLIICYKITPLFFCQLFENGIKEDGGFLHFIHDSWLKICLSPSGMVGHFTWKFWAHWLSLCGISTPITKMALLDNILGSLF